jgi:hypothetical protein
MPELFISLIESPSSKVHRYHIDYINKFLIPFTYVSFFILSYYIIIDRYYSLDLLSFVLDMSSKEREQSAPIKA